MDGVECRLDFILAVLRPVFRGLRHEELCRVDVPLSRHLAVLRPVFRGLRRKVSEWRTISRLSTCSAETRFQGIATGHHGGEVDGWDGPGRLAVLRPVFRGLRLNVWLAPPVKGEILLAVLRPVFRGLRHHAHAGGVVGRPACSAETRFQGIATITIRPRRPFFLVHSCSAETRFQGIATRS